MCLNAFQLCLKVKRFFKFKFIPLGLTLILPMPLCPCKRRRGTFPFAFKPHPLENPLRTPANNRTRVPTPPPDQVCALARCLSSAAHFVGTPSARAIDRH